MSVKRGYKLIVNPDLVAASKLTGRIRIHRGRVQIQTKRPGTYPGDWITKWRRAKDFEYHILPRDARI